MSEMIAKTKRLMIRTLDETDYETVLPLLKEGSIASQYADQPVFLEEFAYRVWKRIVANDYNGLVFLSENNEFCGRVCIQDVENPIPELGIDILKKHQNNGYGPEAIRASANWYGEEHGIKLLKVRIYQSNSHSIHVFEKLGARFEGPHSYFSEDALVFLRERFPDLKTFDFETKGPFTYYLDLPIMTNNR